MKDPVEIHDDGSRDLYDVATWEPRTALDRLAERTYSRALRAGRAFVVGLGVLLLILILAGGIGGVLLDNPFVIGLVVLSIIPAALLVTYVYVTDVTTAEPPTLLIATFVLAVLFAGFAAIINGILGILQLLPVFGIVLFFYLVVGPVEETVKMLAIRLYAFRDDRFDSVIDGAVYGAVAGLGFATIENALYITQNIETPAMVFGQALIDLPLPGGIGSQIGETLEAGGGITAVRGLAGPGHVIYSAFAGYYLGLAKFNPDNAGPIVAKGLLIAAFIHATYNTLVGIVPGLVLLLVPDVSIIVVFFGFVVVYDGLFFYVLYRKLRRYRRVFNDATSDAAPHDLPVARTEFDPASTPRRDW
ncbi:MAG: PrsW family intramembrane metalloprotease [Natronomonas sp.]